MKALVLIAHGSRREASNEEVRELATELARQNSDFDEVYSGFLELAEPSIPDSIRQAAASGATEIVILPYFLSAGRHVVKDIPAEIDSVRDELSGVMINVAPYLGSAKEIPQVLIAQADKIN